MIECRLTEHPIFIIDQGRNMSGMSGVTQSGPLLADQYYFASKILQQSQLVALEISGGCELIFHQSVWLSICGQDAQVTIDEEHVSMYQPHLSKAGQILRIAHLKQGTRLTLGLKANVSHPRYFNSICSVYREKFGGIAEGKPMISGDILPINPVFIEPGFGLKEYEPKCLLESKAFEQPVNMQDDKIDFVPNYQYTKFSIHARYLFTSQPMWMSDKADRMGFRLLCDTAIPVPQHTSSQALALGVIQIPPDGQPIVMGPDRQTHGGYPIIGTVPDYAISQLVQFPVNKAFYFRTISIEEAIVKFSLYQAQINGNDCL